jgi:ABC-type lipoprotein release transport system permease subunit
VATVRGFQRILRRVSFVLIAIAMIGVLVGILVLIGRAYPGSSAELVDWKPTRSPQVEAENEIQDIQQMLEAQNEIRRRRGVPEVDEATLRAEVEAEELERLRWRER